jgi:hypothetical protein
MCRVEVNERALRQGRWGPPFFSPPICRFRITRAYSVSSSLSRPHCRVNHPPLLTPRPSLLRRRSASASAPPPAPATSGSTEAGPHTPVLGESASVLDSLVRPYSVADSSVEGESSGLPSSRDLSAAGLSGGPARDLRSPVDLANGAPVVVHHHRRVGDSAVRPPEPVRAAAGSHSPRGRLLSRGRGGTVTVRRPGRRGQVGDASSSSSASGVLASSQLSRV